MHFPYLDDMISLPAALSILLGFRVHIMFFLSAGLFVSIRWVGVPLAYCDDLNSSFSPFSMFSLMILLERGFAFCGHTGMSPLVQPFVWEPFTLLSFLHCFCIWIFGSLSRHEDHQRVPGSIMYVKTSLPRYHIADRVLFEISCLTAAVLKDHLPHIVPGLQESVPSCNYLLDTTPLHSDFPLSCCPLVSPLISSH